MKYNKEDYVARISTASALQLVVINYELLIGFINEAAETRGTPRVQYDAHIKKAQDALGRLISALDMEYEVSHSLYGLYLYVNKLLNAAFFSRDFSVGEKNLAEATEILQALLTSWEALEKNEQDARPVMENAQHIYAGLTYKNGVLEEYIEDDGKRGFTV